MNTHTHTLIVTWVLKNSHTCGWWALFWVAETDRKQIRMYSLEITFILSFHFSLFQSLKLISTRLHVSCSLWISWPSCTYTCSYANVFNLKFVIPLTLSLLFDSSPLPSISIEFMHTVSVTYMNSSNLSKVYEIISYRFLLLFDVRFGLFLIWNWVAIVGNEFLLFWIVWHLILSDLWPVTSGKFFSSPNFFPLNPNFWHNSFFCYENKDKPSLLSFLHCISHITNCLLFLSIVVVVFGV